MHKCLVAVLLLSLFKGILSYYARNDPFSLTLEQYLSDITFEIIPYPSYPCAYPPYVPYSPNPLVDPWGYYSDYSMYSPMEFEMKIPPCPTCLDFPCGFDYPTCNSYRDVWEPCAMCDRLAPLCICIECDNPTLSPYTYFPQVEYPMTTMDIRPYYYGNYWCT